MLAPGLSPDGGGRLAESPTEGASAGDSVRRLPSVTRAKTTDDTIPERMPAAMASKVVIFMETWRISSCGV